MEVSVSIREHTLLEHCWVCKRKFGPSLARQDHHIIPRAFGGTDGPQVSLCDSHHFALHQIALKLYSQKSFHSFLTPDPETNQRLLYLGSVAYNARLATENDPNKRRVEIVSLTGDTFKKLKRLQTLQSTRISRGHLIETAINQMYSRYFK